MNLILRMSLAGTLAMITFAVTAAPTRHGGAPLAAPPTEMSTFTPKTPSLTAPVSTSARPQPSLQTGQPNASCGSPSAPYTPGNAMIAPGSAFNPDGKAGTVYAGQQPQNSQNPVNVSQYDAACLHQSPH
ncbi:MULTISPECIES: hypothetical protein [unclassified Duganella]|uniref:hypothetical protein n=1 Tax=unclassified Duganella TaxID=2636909 RepID=UPI0011C0FDF1|nr:MULTISPECIES: hypothetical protein [unclassified Duganella]